MVRAALLGAGCLTDCVSDDRLSVTLQVKCERGQTYTEAEVRRRRAKEENLGLELGMSVRGAKKKIHTGCLPPPVYTVWV